MRSKRLAAAAARIERRAGGPVEVAIVLGSGLAGDIAQRVAGRPISYERLHAPGVRVSGHAGFAHAGLWAGKRVVAFAGRTHLYDGSDAQDVTYLVRLAAAAGARVVVLSNAAGALDPRFRSGDLMLVRDHINLTGSTPLAMRGDSFLDMNDAYAQRLRDVARAAANGATLHEGVYAGVRGPQYETPAEARALRRLGADAVGMSTVLETIMARALRCEVLGISLITNAAADTIGVSHTAVLAAATDGAHELLGLIERCITAL